MTLICAWRIPPRPECLQDTKPAHHGGTWIASDRVGMMGWIKSDIGPKWASAGRFRIGCSGSMRAMNLIDRADFSKCVGVGDHVEVLRTALRTDDWVKENGSEGHPPSYSSEFLFTNGNAIWTVCGDFSVSAAHTEGFFAGGSGAQAALGFRGGASLLLPESIHEYLARMFFAVSEIRADCGSQPWVDFVPGSAQCRSMKP